MPTAIVVRSLWGNLTAPTRAKAAQDLKLCENWRRNLRLVEQRFICYGEHNAKLVAKHGYDPILLPDEVPKDWAHVTGGMSDIHGRVTDGLSMWWHKLHAIRVAWEIEPRPEVVLWLDIDTKIRRTVNQKLFRVLSRGPAFQGRLRCYKRMVCDGWRKRDRFDVYHGGCLFFSQRKFLDRTIEIHAQKMPWAMDEQAVTMAVDERIRWRTKAAQHREFGYDNPCLHTTCCNAEPSRETAVFMEGHRMRMDRRIELAKKVKE